MYCCPPFPPPSLHTPCHNRNILPPHPARRLAQCRRSTPPTYPLPTPPESISRFPARRWARCARSTRRWRRTRRRGGGRWSGRRRGGGRRRGTATAS
eukprot:7869767-Pyramimonas_sp.AAC.1